MPIFLYIIVIASANIITAKFTPLNIGIIIPWGTFCIGATFLLRDWVQMRYGRNTAYAAIITALCVSAATSFMLGDPLTIVLASAVSFAIAESTDTEIFTRLKRGLAKRSIVSGIGGGALDSFIFAVVGLIPAGYITWEALPMAVLGQMVVKTLVQFAVLLFVRGEK